ncbi:putative alpha/beta hydrolase [Aspergillus novofumigatus IBT 16806]|uniref:Putative alpha/beta fold family hydrolase n=1 Tax=Aspergillus novofumigatus (strain IBT 16806) TaxID=1392255 RepID=A0A2I1BWI1_ASPN1|nr:putative alpha/beta fold family hydrolase [Aspergillus novofumigatus IBT 16806]PKX89742.1 putative alpha/beta fold family hydrolase [Aspergillus novofumigatus IBT 16806]
MLFARIQMRVAPAIRAFSTSRALASELSYQVVGPEKEQASRNPIVFLHGLFGSKQNNRSIGKVLARDLKRQVFTLDLRNHGHSFHHNEHNYSVMAEDVEKFIHQHDLAKCVLIGHSMGAKTAMTVALQSSDLVSALIPVDNAPINAPLKSDFGKYVQGMQEVEAQGVTKQSDADKLLKEYEESLPIRQFLLTNLVRAEDSQKMKFRIPLSVLGPAIPAMADFPFREPGSVTYDGPTLFVRGTKSKYVSDDTVPVIKKFFPNAEIADVEAGHWLISENPEAFRQAVVKFLQDLP